MLELNGNEKYIYLPGALPSDVKKIQRIHAGDIMLYGSDCLVLFYESFDTSYRYTPIGKIINPAGLDGATAVIFSEVTIPYLVKQMVIAKIRP